MPEAVDAGSPTLELPATRSSQPTTFRLIQVLRAVAALMVVAHHTTILLAQRLHRPGAFWLGGAAGVDLFFVISGLVMTLSAARIPRTPAGARRFLRRRLERIVPLYWIATAAKILLALLLPALAFNAIGTPRHVLASFLFLPSLGPTATMDPVLVAGWTLELEMLFYLLYAVSLLLRCSPWVVVAPTLVLLTCIPRSILSSASIFVIWRDPITLEFLFGMALGACVLRGRYLSPRLSAASALFGLLFLLWPWNVQPAWREIAWGLPATAIIAAAVSLERRFGPRTPAFAQRLGDASYSIYLTHGFALPLLAVGSLGALAISETETVTIFAAISLSIALGLVCYRWIELPLLRWFHLRRAPATP